MPVRLTSVGAYYFIFSGNAINTQPHQSPTVGSRRPPNVALGYRVAFKPPDRRIDNSLSDPSVG
jgi:hypothetical protein